MRPCAADGMTAPGAAAVTAVASTAASSASPSDSAGTSGASADNNSNGTGFSATPEPKSSGSQPSGSRSEIHFPHIESQSTNIYESKQNRKIIRLLTVIAYMFAVSLAAIVLSLYYLFLWDPYPPGGGTTGAASNAVSPNGQYGDAAAAHPGHEGGGGKGGKRGSRVSNAPQVRFLASGPAEGGPPPAPSPPIPSGSRPGRFPVAVVPAADPGALSPEPSSNSTSALTAETAEAELTDSPGVDQETNQTLPSAISPLSLLTRNGTESVWEQSQEQNTTEQILISAEPTARESDHGRNQTAPDSERPERSKRPGAGVTSAVQVPPVSAAQAKGVLEVPVPAAAQAKANKSSATEAFTPS